MSIPETTALADATSLPSHGGKAINLARLLANGFQVPNGFCLPTSWYHDHVSAAGGAEPALILQTPMAADQRAALVAAYRELGGCPVAVRSSATAEDLVDASFAGQQDSYLDVTGEDEVVIAVQRCWASLWNDRAVDYRRQHGVEDAALAVIVQRMVDARTAGVSFTANPLTGARGEVVVDAVRGLGEALVSGRVTPEHFEVPGTTAHAGENMCLDTRTLQTVVDTCRAIEASFGAPQDIEWAIDHSGELWITQSRPITTLYPQPQPRSDAAPRGLDPAVKERVLLCASHSWQGIRGPLTPIGISGLGLAAASVAATGARGHGCTLKGPEYSLALGHRWFLDVSAAAHDDVGRRILLGALGLVDARAARIVESLSLQGPRTSSRWQAVRFLLRLVRRHHVVSNVLSALRNPAGAWRDIRGLRDQIDADGSGLLDNPDPEEVASYIDRWIGAIWARVVPITGLGMALAGLGARAAGVDVTDQRHVAALRAVPGNVTAQMDLDLERIVGDEQTRQWLLGHDPVEAERRRRTGGLPDLLSTDIESFLRDHGHRAVGEIDLGVTRWSTDATPVFITLAGMARSQGERTSTRAHANAQADAAAAIEELAAQAKHPQLVRFAYGRARELLGLREQAKYLNVRVFAGANAAVAALGQLLTDRAVLSAAQDVVFLDFGEIHSALMDGTSRQDLVAGRREDFAREQRRGQVPQILLGDGEQPVEPDLGDDPTRLMGVAGSAGTARGVARVITNPLGAHLEAGEVLVAPTTDPAWTPLFSGAAAVVVETGGVNSHGAVVAREFGIPAVLGIRDLTMTIRTGDLVEVNGSAGWVRRVDEPQDA
ncbi:MAG TPA: hypothetical protein H9987_12430 [Candidatus Luteococcus avicola]|nr:hypothetical protein [Candidatus Luteococcus avicola]